MTLSNAAKPMRAGLESCRQHLLVAAGFSGLVNLLYVAPTLYMLQVYDRVVPTQGRLTLLLLTAVLVLALATLGLLDRARARLLVRAGSRLDRTLAPALLDAVLGRPELPESRRALREFDTLRSALSGPGILALFDAPWLPVYLAVCFLVHPMIGCLTLAGAVVLPLIAWRNDRATRARNEDALATAAVTYANQETFLRHAEALRALGMRRAVVVRQLRERRATLDAQTGAGLAASNWLTLTKCTRLSLQSFALGLGALLAIENSISVGAVFASSFLIARALAPVEGLIGSWKTLAGAWNSYRMLDGLLNEASNNDARTLLPAPKGALMVQDLAVLNEGGDAALLQGIRFAVEPGQVVAIVGPSGAGKSTLLRALAGTLELRRGAVRIDGADIRDWDPERLARHIGFLPQEAALFPGTIKENIARFASELEQDKAAIDAEVVAAACRVGADDLIRTLPGGYDYLLGLGGRGLSAGQAQRIALARAAFRAPALWLLDEPNAHLDSEGDQCLIEAIAAAKRAGTTVLIVSHKLSVLPAVDQLLVLRGGRVEHFGRRDDVLPKMAPLASRRTLQEVAA